VPRNNNAVNTAPKIPSACMFKNRLMRNSKIENRRVSIDYFEIKKALLNGLSTPN